MRNAKMWKAAFVAAGLLWTSVAMAQSGGGDGTPLSDHKLVGRVVSVNPQQRWFEIRVDEGATPGAQASTDTAKLMVAPNAHIVRDGINVPFRDLRPGDEVRASFPSTDLTRTHPWEVEARSPGGRVPPWGGAG